MPTFKIVRFPDKEPSFLYNNILVHYVGTCPETGISFYSSTRCTYGVKVFPDGRKAVENTCTCNTPNSKVLYNARRKQHYLYFRHAFGQGKGILAAHAVWMAAGRTVPEGMTIDHINGCTTDNCIENLRCVSNALNVRDGGFLRKLRNKGINPVAIQRSYLLRYFARMAKIKEAISPYKYERLTFDILRAILYLPKQELTYNLLLFYEVEIEFQL
ncbi:MAG: HNH endonuclease [Paludibacteraceae bacterium]|nr:HNH endonuclease [Paludibacteraceae bacterium]MBQ8705151.1 HNH endonuclease [Paludibacteraceae bacterium]